MGYMGGLGRNEKEGRNDVTIISNEKNVKVHTTRNIRQEAATARRSRDWQEEQWGHAATINQPQACDLTNPQSNEEQTLLGKTMQLAFPNKRRRYGPLIHDHAREKGMPVHTGGCGVKNTGTLQFPQSTCLRWPPSCSETQEHA